MAGKKRTRQDVETRFIGKDDLTPFVDKIGGNLLKLAKQYGPVAAGIGAVVAAEELWRRGMIETARQIQTSITVTADQAVKVQGLSDALGLSTEAVQGFGFASEKAGVPADQLNMAIQRMTRRIGEAAKGTGEAKKTIEELRLPIDELVKMRPEDQFLTISDALEKVKGSSSRLASAFKFFDSEGARPVLQLMRRFPGALRDQIERAKELGGVYRTDLIRRSLEWKSAQVELQTAMKGVRAELADQLLPVATKAVDAITEFVSKNRKQIQEFGEDLSENFERGLETVKRFLDTDGEKLGALLKDWAAIAGKSAELIISVSTGAVDIYNWLVEHTPAPGRVSEEFAARLRAEAEALQQTIDAMEAGERTIIEQIETRADKLAEFRNEWDAVMAEFEAFEIPVRPTITQEEAIKALEEDLFELEQAVTARGPREIPFYPKPRRFGEPFPEEGAEGFPGVPEPEKIDYVSERFGNLTEAVERFGEDAVEQTLLLNRALENVGKQAKAVFVDEFGRSLQGMGRAFSYAIAANLNNMRGFKEAATAIWRGFVTEVIAMLIRLIAKLMLAAVLQSFLGFGTATAASATGQVRALAGITGLVPMAEKFGGSVRRQFGGGVPIPTSGAFGDRVPLIAEGGEFVFQRAAVNRIGRSALAAWNADVPPPAGSEFVAGRGTTLFVPLTVHTVYSSRDAGHEVGRGIWEFMADQGLVVAG